MPAGLMVRNRLENKFITEAAFLRLNRAGLAKSGLAAAEVTASGSTPQRSATRRASSSRWTSKPGVPLRSSSRQKK